MLWLSILLAMIMDDATSWEQMQGRSGTDAQLASNSDDVEVGSTSVHTSVANKHIDVLRGSLGSLHAIYSVMCAAATDGRSQGVAAKGAPLRLRGL